MALNLDEIINQDFQKEKKFEITDKYFLGGKYITIKKIPFNIRQKIVSNRGKMLTTNQDGSISIKYSEDQVKLERERWEMVINYGIDFKKNNFGDGFDLKDIETIGTYFPQLLREIELEILRFNGLVEMSEDEQKKN